MENASKCDKKSILFLEAFHGGSHKQLIDLLENNFCDKCDVFCMSDKKWHWRMRTGSLYFARTIPREHSYRYLFTSANFNLAELIGLRPDLQKLEKILYFHENQLVYPVRKQQNRDFQYGYNQVLSCLAADVIYFNSVFNKESFLSSLKSYFNLMPDYKPDEKLLQEIQPKCHVLHFPISFPEITLEPANADMSADKPLHIVWAHRWEHDKNPDTFFDILYALKDEELDFQISVMGQGYADVPEVFAKAREDFKERIVTWGYLESKEEFLKTLSHADVAVSTALHEFFGVSMLEAVSCGCYPLCPKRLVYPEIFPDEYLYNTKNQLLKRLRQFCKRPETPRRHKVKELLQRPCVWSL
ncbi:tRNA-queuosine alpha-mannosyltransferase-like isoform X2 [Rhopilema esculentum]|uniref:tRNA-queuosine alpha-mannosyltransferase-like isoform X2 n=1 Tax=Rhopilema esculentum TaxID=499914 RepID=UPI0031E48925